MYGDDAVKLVSHRKVKLVSHRNQLSYKTCDGVSRSVGRDYPLGDGFFTTPFFGCRYGAAPLTPDTPVIAPGFSQ